VSDAIGLTGPTQQFINDMTALGANARADGPRILYEVVAVGGALNGQTTTTGVSVSEVQSWPMVPPHWIHLPDSVAFPETNMDDIDMSLPPALAWLRHVRGFISIAIPKAA
jgi:hypothetical protein